MSRAWWAILKKEVRETVRDRRTIFVMVGIPILLYPAMFVLVEQVLFVGAADMASRTTTVAVQGALPAELGASVRGLDHVRVVDAPPGMSEAAVRRGTVDLLVRAEPADSGLTLRVKLFYDERSGASELALGKVRKALDDYGAALVRQRLEARGLPPGLARPVERTSESVAKPLEAAGFTLGRFLPVLLVLVTMLGTFYPAIDLAAGEKERGTLEALVTAPVPAWQIVAGKFATVAIMGIFAAVLNVGSIYLTLNAGLAGIAGQGGFGGVLDWQTTALILATLAPVAILFAGVFLGLATRARSLKEAQNVLTPIYTLAVLPAMLPGIPGIAMTPALAAVPVAGIALLIRELLAGQADPGLAVIAVATTTLYAVLALLFAARGFGSEEVLFGSDEHRASPRRLGALLGSFGAHGGRLPRAGEAVAFVALVAALYFYVGRTFVSGPSAAAALRGTMLAEWLLLFLPALAFVFLGGYDPKATLALRRPAPRELLAGLLVMAGGLPLGWYLAWAQKLVIALPEGLLRGMAGLLTATSGRELLLMLLATAVTPAICEEVVFRGILLSGSRRFRLAVTALLLNALLFGAFHLSYETVFRFLPTAWVGLLLATVVWRTRSIFTSSLMHLLNNAALLLLAARPGVAAFLLAPGGAPRLYLLPPALLSLGAGLWLLFQPAPRAASRAARRRPPTGEPAAESDG